MVLLGQLCPQIEYTKLAFYAKHACIPPEHESAVKRAIWNLTLGLAHVRGGGVESTLTFQALQSLKTKLQIWQFFDVAKPVELKVAIVTSEFSSNYAATKMLAGEKAWVTKYIPAIKSRASSSASPLGAASRASMSRPPQRTVSTRCVLRRSPRRSSRGTTTGRTVGVTGRGRRATTPPPRSRCRRRLRASRSPSAKKPPTSPSPASPSSALRAPPHHRRRDGAHRSNVNSQERLLHDTV